MLLNFLQNFHCHMRGAFFVNLSGEGFNSFFFIGFFELSLKVRVSSFHLEKAIHCHLKSVHQIRTSGQSYFESWQWSLMGLCGFYKQGQPLFVAVYSEKERLRKKDLDFISGPSKLITFIFLLRILINEIKTKNCKSNCYSLT